MKEYLQQVARGPRIAIKSELPAQLATLLWGLDNLAIFKYLMMAALRSSFPKGCS